MRQDVRKKVSVTTEETVEASSGNVFADLGLKNPVELLAKAELVQRISDIIAERKLTQARAAKLLGIDQPKVSALPLDLAVHAVSGNARLIADDRLTRTDQSVEERGLADIRSSDDSDEWLVHAEVSLTQTASITRDRLRCTFDNNP